MNRTFAALVFACALSSAAMAQERSTGLLTMSGKAFAETVSINVTISDLDLTKDTDQHKLTKRLRYAMANICGAAPANAAVRLMREYAACKASLKMDSISQGNPAKVNAMTLAFNNLD